MGVLIISQPKKLSNQLYLFLMFMMFVLATAATGELAYRAEKNYSSEVYNATRTKVTLVNDSPFVYVFMVVSLISAGLAGRYGLLWSKSKSQSLMANSETALPGVTK